MTFRRKQKEPMHIELTPLIDAVFILLIFYMLSSTFLKPAVNIILPVIEYREQVEEKKKIVITVDKDSRLFVNSEQTQFSDIEKAIAKYIDEDELDVNVFFSADKRIEYDVFVKIMGVLKSLGIQNIALENDTAE